MSDTANQKCDDDVIDEEKSIISTEIPIYDNAEDENDVTTESNDVITESHDVIMDSAKSVLENLISAIDNEKSADQNDVITHENDLNPVDDVIDLEYDVISTAKSINNTFSVTDISDDSPNDVIIDEENVKIDKNDVIADDDDVIADNDDVIADNNDVINDNNDVIADNDDVIIEENDVIIDENRENSNKNEANIFFKTDLVKQFVENFAGELINLRQISPDTRFIDAVNQFYEHSSSMQPLAMKKVMESGQVARPLGCLVPPSQIVYLLAEYSSERTLDSIRNELSACNNLTSNWSSSEVEHKFKFANFACPNFTRTLCDLGLSSVRAYLGNNAHTDSSPDKSTLASGSGSALVQGGHSYMVKLAAKTTNKKRKRASNSTDSDESDDNSAPSVRTVSPDLSKDGRPRDQYTIYRCMTPHCDFSADTLIGLDRHKRIPHRYHFGNFRWICALCKQNRFKCGSRGSLKEHVFSKHHVTLNFQTTAEEDLEDSKCVWCEKVFSRKRTIVSHSRVCYHRFLTQGPQNLDDQDVINRWLWPKFVTPGLRPGPLGVSNGPSTSGAPNLPTLITVQKKQIAPSVISFTPASSSSSSNSRVVNTAGKPPGPPPLPKNVRKTVKDIVELVSANKIQQGSQGQGHLTFVSGTGTSATNFRPVRSAAPLVRITTGAPGTVPKQTATYLIRNDSGQLVNLATSSAFNNGQLSTANASTVSWTKTSLTNSKLTAPANQEKGVGAYSGADHNISSANLGNINISCELCDIGFTTKFLYVKHLKYGHSKLTTMSDQELAHLVPLLSCSRCRDRFYTCDGLERHLLMSHSLVTADLLYKAHRKQDSGKCRTCGKIYAFNLLHHLVLDHKQRLCSAKVVYNCDLCLHQFQTYVALESHLMAKHPKAATNCVPSALNRPFFGGPPPPKLRQMMPVLSPNASGIGALVLSPPRPGASRLVPPPSLRGRQQTAFRGVRPASGQSAAAASLAPPTPTNSSKLIGGRGKRKFRSMAVILANQKRKQEKKRRSSASADQSERGEGGPNVAQTPKKPLHYWCTPCKIKFSVYAQVLAHWSDRHLKKVKILTCRIDKCEKCQLKLTQNGAQEARNLARGTPKSATQGSNIVSKDDSSIKSANNIKSTGLKLNLDPPSDNDTPLVEGDSDDDLQLVEFVKPVGEVICID